MLTARPDLWGCTKLGRSGSIRHWFVFLLTMSVTAGALLAGRQVMGSTFPVGSVPSIDSPLGLPPVAVPENNHPTNQTVALGQRLFFDPILSGNGAFSCATCHKPQLGFSDDKPLTKGAAGHTSRRNVSSVVNSAYFTSLFWDGRASTLESQAAIPVESEEEMANTILMVEQRLNADGTYREEFAKLGVWAELPSKWPQRVLLRMNVLLFPPILPSTDGNTVMTRRRSVTRSNGDS
jgi:cytochrome c peroxidase